jgi:hypothetical protein
VSRSPALRWVRRAVVAAIVLGAPPLAFYACAVDMPGSSHPGPTPELDPDQELVRDRMQADLAKLAGDIGERHVLFPRAYRQALVFLEESLQASGWEPTRETFDIGIPDQTCHNLIAEAPGEEQGWVVVGAHYDTARGSPGANDNGTGVVALLELARRLRSDRARHGLRIVFFANEEPPHFNTDKMGSRVHARRAAERGDRIVAMLSLETMGYFSEADDSQKYPPVIGLFYPSRGDFLAFIGNYASRDLVRDSVGQFREAASLPSEGAVVPEAIPGVSWSDHASFWAHGWPAIMITDTAPFRYPHYHEGDDTPDKVDLRRLVLAVDGITAVVRRLRRGDEPG